MEEWLSIEGFQTRKDEYGNCHIRKRKGKTWSVLTLSEEDVKMIIELYKEEEKH